MVKMKVINNTPATTMTNMAASKLRVTIERLASIIQTFKRTGDSSPYQPILTILKRKPLPSKLFCCWFNRLIDCVPLLDRQSENLVIDMLKIPWHYGDDSVESVFRKFILSLLTGHNYYAYTILERLLKELPPEIDNMNSESMRMNPFQFSQETKLANRKIIQLVVDICNHVPLCHNSVLTIVRGLCPYFKTHVHIHISFTYNMLLLGELLPKLRKQILEIIISNMVKLDLQTPKVELIDDEDDDEDSDGYDEESGNEMEENNDIFEMTLEEKEVRPARKTKQIYYRIMSHPIGHSLDMLMCLMFKYIHYIVHGGEDLSSVLTNEKYLKVNGCSVGSVYVIESDKHITYGCECNKANQDIVAVRELYLELKTVFGKSILPTYSTSYVQYILFYILSIRPALVSDFLDYLKCKFETAGNSRDVKCQAIYYLGGLLSRGTFIGFSHIHSCIEILHNWCTSYLQSEFVTANKYEDIHLHATFYNACQILFYVFTFNYREYSENKARLKLAQSLHLDEIVLCPLNPLRYCMPVIVVNFAAVSYHYQLAYCYSTIEKNRRVAMPVAKLDSCGAYTFEPDCVEISFPFDPYLLKRSKIFISSHYRKFEPLPEEIAKHSIQSAEEYNYDEYEDDNGELNMTPHSLNFSYEMSPRQMQF